MASLSGSIEAIRVALNSTIPDIDGAKCSKIPARLNMVDDLPTCSKLSD